MLADGIIGHLCGDFLLQSDYIAKNKKRSSAICGLHCLIWTSNVCLFANLGWLSFLFLFVTHYIQDRGTLVSHYMDFVGQGGFRKTFPEGLGPWSVIVVDNVLHLLAIWVAISLPLRVGYPTLELLVQRILTGT